MPHPYRSWSPSLLAWPLALALLTAGCGLFAVTPDPRDRRQVRELEDARQAALGPGAGAPHILAFARGLAALLGDGSTTGLAQRYRDQDTPLPVERYVEECLSRLAPLGSAESTYYAGALHRRYAYLLSMPRPGQSVRTEDFARPDHPIRRHLEASEALLTRSIDTDPSYPAIVERTRTQTELANLGVYPHGSRPAVTPEQCARARGPLSEPGELASLIEMCRCHVAEEVFDSGTMRKAYDDRISDDPACAWISADDRASAVADWRQERATYQARRQFWDQYDREDRTRRCRRDCFRSDEEVHACLASCAKDDDR